MKTFKEFTAANDNQRRNDDKSRMWVAHMHASKTLIDHLSNPQVDGESGHSDQLRSNMRNIKKHAEHVYGKNFRQNMVYHSILSLSRKPQSKLHARVLRGQHGIDHELFK